MMTLKELEVVEELVSSDLRMEEAKLHRYLAKLDRPLEKVTTKVDGERISGFSVTNGPSHTLAIVLNLDLLSRLYVIRRKIRADYKSRLQSNEALPWNEEVGEW